MLLAGDLGGTKTLLGLFRDTPDHGRGDERPESVVTRQYPTLDFKSLDDIVATFLRDTKAQAIDGACIGVAGPVTGLVARLTNVPWLADAAPIASRLDCPVHLLNDLEAMAYSVPVLTRDELAVLQDGAPSPTGNAALIAAGTGLGQALLHNVNGRFRPSASEGGHADFAARTRRELALVEALTRDLGRVDNEAVISGHGIINLFRFTHGSSDLATACRIVDGTADIKTLPALITAAALDHRCEQCVETLDMFVEAFGSEAGNLALRSVATAGVYLGGGIAPKILPALRHGPFMDAFRNKEPLADMLRALPVKVILNPAAGLLGAAVKAAELTEGTRRG